MIEDQQKKPDDYEGGKLALSEQVSAPRYEHVMAWMEEAGDCEITFDFWARGNYTRRLLHLRQEGIKPVLVQIENRGQMTWAYQRLALLGLPVEFIYTGPLSPIRKIFHMHPDGLVDIGGWGYFATTSLLEHRGKKWFPLIGSARLMPSSIVGFLLEEAKEAFLKGDAFIAPADLVGVQGMPSGTQLDPLRDLTNGVAISNRHSPAEQIFNLDLPAIDGLTAREFSRFLSDYEDELARFRLAFRRLIMADPDSPDRTQNLIEELRGEIAEILHAAKFHRMRQLVTTLNGAFVTFTVSLAAIAGAKPEILSTVAGVAAAGAAGKTLFDIWQQSIEFRKNISAKPFSILWRLGAKKPSMVSRKHVGGWRRLQAKAPDLEVSSNACHWLCPPTCGLNFVFVKKEPDAVEVV